MQPTPRRTRRRLPIAQAFPAADIVALDLGAPVLRYGTARAHAMGVR